MAKVKRIAVSTVAIASIFIGAGAATAQDSRIQDIVEEVDESNRLAQASQQRIDAVADETSRLFQEYKAVLKTNAGLQAYNAQQRSVIAEQLAQIETIKKSIGQIDEIKRQITPLMMDMIADLEEFVRLDVPFQLEERLERIENLRDNMDDPNIADPERFRLVLEAYQAEVTYGRTRRAYEGTLTSGPDEGLSVNFARLGRVGLYYQTKDGSTAGIWNRETKAWERLDAEYNTAVRQLIRMARNQVPVDVLVLPVPTPTEK